MKLLDRLFTREDINGHDRCPTYMHRWTLLKLWAGMGVYLHHFVGDDWSRDMHDHPKRFISIGLRGAYVEETPTPKMPGFYSSRAYHAPWVRTFPATHIHRIRLFPNETCWTLVIVLRTKRKWGFWHDGKWVGWRQYITSSQADESKLC